MLLPSFYRLGSRSHVGANLAVVAAVVAVLLIVLILRGWHLPALLLVAAVALLGGGSLVVGLQHRLQRSREPERSHQRRTAELERRMQERTADLRLAATVVENTSEGVMVVSEDGVIQSVNPAFTEITGYAATEVIGRTPALLRSDMHDPSFYQGILERLLASGRWQGEVWSKRKNGVLFPEWLTINLLPAANGVAASYVAVFVDITEQRKKEERIRHLAFHDALTGLPNRSLLFDRLQHALQKARRERHGVAAMFLDLDGFKGVNDTLGHEVGDLLLQEIAKRLSTCLRETDTVARMGGDEFVVLLESLDEPEHAANVAANLISVISLPQEIAGYNVQVGGSVGIALYPGDSDNAVDLLKFADTAMYAAKMSGKGTFRFFHAAMTAQASARLKLETDLRRAVQAGELELYYQPETGLDTRLPRGVEALLRWRHPERGLLGPDDFFRLAEETGLMDGIGDWVLEAACRQQAEWQRRGVNFPLAVNVSVKQLLRGDLPERIHALSLSHGLRPGSLRVELKEAALMAEPMRYGEIFSRLREKGVRVVVDGFGAAASSLAYLGRLPIDALKIDRSVIAGGEDDPDCIRVVAGMVALARALQLGVVAEGVETEAQASWLQTVGCPAAQGFLFAPPAPANVAERWLLPRH